MAACEVNKNSPLYNGSNPIAKEKVQGAVNDYEAYHASFGGDVEKRKTYYADLTNKYYDLCTQFYEYGWGESFHFAPRNGEETHRESLKRHEHYLALRLGISSSSRVADLGCGVGGPAREISTFSGAHVTGVNNNAYQVKRAGEITAGKAWRNAAGDTVPRCNFVKADFMNLPMEEGSFDAAYAIEATCHAPDLTAVYKEIYRVLKPGGVFAAYEWLMTDKYDPENETHRRIKQEIELGNGIADLRTIEVAERALVDAGFEVVETVDVCATGSSKLSWYDPLAPKAISLSSFRTSTLGRFITRNMVFLLETLGLAPKGTIEVSNFLERGADNLVEGGELGIFTPAYLVVGRKKC